jgi:uncharacterized repeat protein (TIGR03847 family)
VGKEIELDPADNVAVGTVGPPGQRAFYIQAHSADRTLTILVEKVQVQALSERAVKMLEGQEVGDAEGPAELKEPVQADWRAGQLGLGFDEDRRLVVLVAQEAAEDEDVQEETLTTARVWMRPEQALGLSAKGLELVAKGRPLCPLCGLPMDAEGHLCPRKNGKSPIF